MVIPILFIGCVNSKTALITPKFTDKNNTISKETGMKKTNMLEDNKSSLLKDIPNVEHSQSSVDNTLNIENNQKRENTLTTLPTDFTTEDRPLNSVIFTEALVIPTLSLYDSFQNNFEDEISKEDEILETATLFLGTKYIWAANGPSAFDCSGFTKYVFNQIGISLPRYSGHQANIGKKIKFSELQKGDLVFFDTTKKFKRKVNHVGIFIGDNKFIHASSAKKKVIITSFDKKKFYKNKFLYARRVINSNESFALSKIDTTEEILIN